MSRAYLQDIEVLNNLEATIRHCADRSLRLRAVVGEYMEDVSQSFQQYVEECSERLEEANSRLRSLKRALYRAYDSDDASIDDVWRLEEDIRDQEEKIPRLEQELEQAKDSANVILEAINNYFEDASLLAPRGGDKLLRDLMTSHTEKALSKLERIRGIANDYISLPVVRGKGQSETKTPTNLSQTEAYTEKRRSIQKEVRQKQIFDARYYKQKEASSTFLCLMCKRPIIICGCKLNKI